MKLMHTLKDTVTVLEAVDRAVRRGATAAQIVEALNGVNKDVTPSPKPVTYYCNKCGAFPDAMEHLRPNTLTPCQYLAVSSDWKDKL